MTQILPAPVADAQASAALVATESTAPATTTKRSRRSPSVKLTARPGAAGDTLPAQSAPASVAQVSADVQAAASPAEKLKAENSRLQGLLRDTQAKLAAATAATEPALPISDADLKPLMAEHIRTGASIGRWELTKDQKLAWKATKKARKALINGRIYRKRVLGNVTRAANEGAFSRYRERVAAKSKRLAGFTLGASFAAPKAAKADKPAGKK